MAKKPIPTAPKPQPATSLYLKVPKPINSNPIDIIINVAQPRIVFLFIPIIFSFFYSKLQISVFKLFFEITLHFIEMNNFNYSNISCKLQKLYCQETKWCKGPKFHHHNYLFQTCVQFYLCQFHF